MSAEIKLTESSLKLFKDLVESASNWNGIPLYNEDGTATKADNANLTDLKKKGLITTQEDVSSDIGGKKVKIQWVNFTKDGYALAEELCPEKTFSLEDIKSTLRG